MLLLALACAPPSFTLTFSMGEDAPERVPIDSPFCVEATETPTRTRDTPDALHLGLESLTLLGDQDALLLEAGGFDQVVAVELLADQEALVAALDTPPEGDFTGLEMEVYYLGFETQAMLPGDTSAATTQLRGWVQDVEDRQAGDLTVLREGQEYWVTPTGALWPVEDGRPDQVVTAWDPTELSGDGQVSSEDEGWADFVWDMGEAEALSLDSAGETTADVRFHATDRLTWMEFGEGVDGVVAPGEDCGLHLLFPALVVSAEE